IIYVVPEHDIVAVVTSYFTPTEGGYIPDHLFETFVLPAIEGPVGETTLSFFIPLIIGVVIVSFYKNKRRK
ncbi:MAG: hypothetical protein ACXABJ_05885, partial [Candidatus Heimdallarchaeaceae archaeon]